MKFSATRLAGSVSVIVVACLGIISPADAQQEIKIGALLPFSGPATSWGISLAGAAELAAEEVNATGGLEVNGKRHKVSVLRYDDKYKASDAVTGMNRLIYEDKAKFVITVASASQLAVAQMATENKVLMITQAFAPRVLDKSYPYTFRAIFSANEFGGPQTAWLAKKLGARKVGVLFPNDESGQQIALDFAKSYGAVRTTLVREFFERDRVDFSPLLTRMIDQKIDAIDLDGNSPTTAGLIVKQARELGFKGPIVRTGGESTQDIIDVAGSGAAEGLYVHLPANLKDPKVVPYKKRFEDKYKIAVSAASVPMYVSVKLLFSAMQKARTVDDVDKITKALEETKDLDTLMGKLNWINPKDPSGKPYGVKHQIMANFYIGQVRSGEVQIAARCSFDGCE